MNANTETLIRRATRLVTNLRSARKYEDKAGRATATDHYLGAARAMLDDDSDSPRFYRICAAVAAELLKQQVRCRIAQAGIEEDQLVVGRADRPLEDLAAIGASPKWFKAPARDQDLKTLRLIMKDGKIYKNTLN